MAFGFSPKHIEDYKTPDLSSKEALVIATEVAKKLDWNLSHISESGFLAYTKFSWNSWSEEVRIKITEGSINIKSEVTGSQVMDWGKNKANVKLFTNTFDELKNRFSQEEIESKFIGLQTELITDEEDILNKPPLSQKEKINEFFSIFKPTNGYFVSPILINLNIAIFILMAITGVSIFEPDSESLLLWGANFKPLTLEGEWWRLITCSFLHIGVLHLLFNMYALLYIGLILEPYLGTSRFLSAYLLTGIASSVASLYWNDFTVSAGASGAIFGMYGVFLAMLTTNLIDKSARRAFLTSIIVFVGYNLLNGLKGDIDNAGHIGGLVSGLLIGYAFYPSLRKPDSSKTKYITIGALSVLILASSFAFLTNASQSDFVQYEKEMERFAELEGKALSIYNMPEGSTNEAFKTQITEVGLPNWHKSIELLDGLKELDLPVEVRARNTKLKEYCELRIKIFTLIHKAIIEDTDAYQTEIEGYSQQIELIFKELGA